MRKRRAEKVVISSLLSRLMGEKRVRIIDVARATGISRNMLSKLYHDRARRVDLSDIAQLCDYFGCSIGELFETVR
jgi:putative transcriptional regulator